MIEGGDEPALESFRAACYCLVEGVDLFHVEGAKPGAWNELALGEPDWRCARCSKLYTITTRLDMTGRVSLREAPEDSRCQRSARRIETLRPYMPAPCEPQRETTRPPRKAYA